MASKNTSSSPTDGRKSSVPTATVRAGSQDCCCFSSGCSPPRPYCSRFLPGGRPERAAALARGTCHAGRRARKSLRLAVQAGTLLVDNSFGVSGILIPVMVVLVGVRVIRQRPLLVQPIRSSRFFLYPDSSVRLTLASPSRTSGAFAVRRGGAVPSASRPQRCCALHIGVLGTLILLLGCWILTGVFINRNFINTVNTGRQCNGGQGRQDRRSGQTVGRECHRPSFEIRGGEDRCRA